MAFKTFDVPGIGSVTVYKRRGTSTLRLRVSSGQVQVTIPAWSAYSAGVDFALARQAWIVVQLPSEVPLLYDGMPVGKTRTLHFVTSAGATVRTRVLSDKVLITHSSQTLPKTPAVQTVSRAACYRALKTETSTLIVPRLGDLAYEYGFTYQSVNVKRLTSRWGSCDQRHNITLNLFLAQLPWPLIDYVLLHELVHTRVLNHGPDFWEAFQLVLPDARLIRKQLRGHRPELQVS